MFRGETGYYGASGEEATGMGLKEIKSKVVTSSRSRENKYRNELMFLCGRLEIAQRVILNYQFSKIYILLIRQATYMLY